MAMSVDQVCLSCVSKTSILIVICRYFDINETNGDLTITMVEQFHAGEYGCRIRISSQGCIEDSNNATFIVVNGMC